MRNFLNGIRFGPGTGPIDLSGLGSPEGVVSAPVGSTFRRSDGALNSAFYRKETGSGNTGWIAVSNAGGGGAVIYTATLDFGAVPVPAKTFVFAHGGAALGQKIIMVASAAMTGTLSEDELEADMLVCAAKVSAADVITAVVSALPGPVSGTRNFNYQLI
jgi:hypothetical protein